MWDKPARCAMLSNRAVLMEMQFTSSQHSYGICAISSAGRSFPKRLSACSGGNLRSGEVLGIDDLSRRSELARTLGSSDEQREKFYQQALEFGMGAEAARQISEAAGPEVV